MRPIPRLLTALLAGTVLAITATGARADTRPPGSGWEPYRTQPFVHPAGNCDFAVRGDIVKDEEWVRTLATDHAGNAIKLEFTGPLVIRFTNESSGASVVRNLDGTAWVTNHPDGSHTWLVNGHLSAGVPAGDPYLAPGEYIWTGRTGLQIHPGRLIEVLFHLGPPAENLCRTLG
jgi:hypothetical protein